MQNNTFARASRYAFIVHFFTVLWRDYDVKMPNCKFDGGRKQVTMNLLFSL